ncbi:hypothetical protein [Corynebacterium epidermidicanis]|uniref:hypothetical protein n=1 Tax=Corynebacterium epidermidicanis TaxID=1050174 RepID=UPI00069BEBF2|nr:hypothetical protein [Corynebacterium epidermidicanis]
MQDINAWIRPFGLPDPDDKQVVIAAKLRGAGAIVINNLREFPRNRIPTGTEVKSPRVFSPCAVDINSFIALIAQEEMTSRFEHPSMGLEEYQSALINLVA